MITTIFTFVIFTLGFLTAFIDWNKFLKDLVDLQKVTHKAHILLMLAITLLGFYLIMYLPAQYLVIRSESKVFFFYCLYVRKVHFPYGSRERNGEHT